MVRTEEGKVGKTMKEAEKKTGKDTKTKTKKVI